MTSQKTERARRRLGRLRRWLLLVAGSLSLGLGLLGIVVPILPTTPFLILAAICFGRSSDRCYGWLVTNRVFGRYLRDYLQGTGVAWRIRVPILAVLWLVIGLTALLIVDHIAARAALFVVAAAVTVHVVWLRKPVSGTRDKRSA
jgi:uncharacterized membrane protein YbaN (DUF454 family)